ncbi:MAG TPA: hypothetical protein VN721_12000 [Flavipsychrobacter sp.]|nr:hypothetical protein [Flavipsychrobacter sp.]
MINKAYYFLIPILCAFSMSVSAQITTGYVQNPLSTPQGGDLPSSSLSGNGVNNNYSVDLFSGTANISIPIYPYSVDGLDLGVSLSYNTGGIKVDQTASCEGLGWNLAAGGYIVRNVYGLEDEATLQPLSGLPRQKGMWVDSNTDAEYDKFTAVIGSRTVNFIVQHSADQGCADKYYIITDNPKTNTNLDKTPSFDLEILIDSNSLYNYGYGMNNGRIDTGADVYSNYKILSFKITDENQNQWFFSRGDYENRAYYNPSLSSSGTYYPIDKWNLVKVVTHTGQTVLFNYALFSDITYPYYAIDKVTEQLDYTDDYPTFHPGFFKVDSCRSQVWWYGTLSHLASIQYPNGVTINFNMDNDWRSDLYDIPALDSITINSKYDNNVSNTLTYHFNYAYFKAGSLTDIPYPNPTHTVDMFNFRLKLNSIYKVGTDHKTKELIDSFAYNMSTPLPARLSPSVDYYGYYNGNTPATAYVNINGIDSSSYYSCLNNVAIPYHTIAGLIDNNKPLAARYGLDRTPNINYATADILTTIVNGSGGQTLFSYTSHNLSNPPEFQSPSSNSGYYNSGDYGYSYTGTPPPSPGIEPTEKFSSDGVCISGTQTFDGPLLGYSPQNQILTNYTYSGGMRFYPGGYFWYPTVTVNRYLGTLDSAYWGRIYLNYMVSSQDYVNGFNHGYSDVTVKTKSLTGEILSNRHMHFTNLISKPNEITDDAGGKSRLQCRWGLWAHTSPESWFKSSLLGLPIEIDDSDQNGHLISQTTNLYECDSLPDTTLAYAMSERDFIPAAQHYLGIGIDGLYDTYYPIYNHVGLLKTSTTNTFSGTSGQYMQTVKNYTYDVDDDDSTVTWTDSRGQNYIETYTYDTSGYNYWYSLCNFHIYFHSKFLVQHQISPQGVGLVNYTKTVINHIGITPPYDALNPGTINFPASYGLIGIDPLSATAVKAKDYIIYDSHFNVLETKYNNDLKIGSAIWDSRIAKKVVDVSNAEWDNIAATSFEGVFGAYGSADTNKGNWDFDPAAVVYNTVAANKPITGRYYYQLGNPIKSVFPLVNGKIYVLSLWATAAPTLKWSSGTTVSATLTSQAQIGIWHLYTTYITGNGLTLNISGTSKIDELRLYPSDASMDTYTYEPLLGVSSHCDNRDNITYYEYDALGRLKDTKDINGNILSLTQYVKQGPNN